MRIEPRQATALRPRYVGTAALALAAAAAPLAAQEPGAVREETIPGTGVTISLAYAPDGSFLMGSPDDEPGRDGDEGPVHEVRVSAFWMTVHEITHDQFGPFRYRRLDTDTAADGSAFDVDAVTRPSPPYEDPSHGMGQQDHPASGMTRLSALHYARWLSEKTGRLYRLPTEAEWEYACGAGSEASDPDAGAWFEANASGVYHPVGGKAANRWGLLDMQGNVAEWVLDEYVSDAYGRRNAGAGVVDPVVGRATAGRGIVRGGSFDDPPERLRCAERFPETPAWKRRDPQIPKSRWWNTDSPHVGFRLVSPARPHTREEITAYWARVLGEG